MTESYDGPGAPPPTPTPGPSGPEPLAPSSPSGLPPGAGSHWRPSNPAPSGGGAPASPGGPAAPLAASTPTGPVPAAAAGGVPPRPNPLPPPRPVRPGPTESSYGGSSARPATTSRPVTRPRRARLILKRVDPWSVFLYSVVSSIFLGVALVVASVFLYAVLSKLGVLTSLNKLIGDVTAEPGTTAEPAHYFSFGKVLTFSVLLAAVNVVLLTALATLGAFLYNLCAALTGGIEVTLSDQD